MPGSLDGRRVAITGASSGIGAATAELLAGEGAAVAIGARREDRLNELAEKIGSAGGRAVALRADVADESSANEFVRRAHEELGGLDALVNNAGVMLLGPIQDADTEQWRRMIDVNLLGLLYCTHAALPLMRDAGGGHIVNISSVAGRVASLGSGVYNLTKWGVGAFSESLRQEVGGMGIRVTIVEPGYVDTELQGHNEHPMVLEGIKRMQESIPKVLDAEDIARAIHYALAQPQHVSVNEVLVRPTGQPR
jgi:NADP-dependent 3-hydroxy acid dehydrogenase YdfG